MSTTAKTWSWNDAPFSTKLDPRRFYAGVSQEESLSRLHFLVDNRRRMGVLTGPSGCGKSMLLDVAARQFRRQNRQVVLLSAVGLGLDEFLWQLGAGLGANPPIDTSIRQLWRDVNDRIKASRYQQINTVIMVDDLEEAETEVLSAVTRILHLDASDDSFMTVVAACETGRTHLLGESIHEQCELHVELEAWTREEVEDFVRSALSSAACSPDMFTSNSIGRLMQLSDGIPRRVQQLAQLSLIAAAAQDLSEIDELTLDAVEQELSSTSW